VTIVEGISLWLAVAGYALAFVALAATILVDRRALRATGWLLALGGWIAHSVAIVARWIATGHAPVMGAYEHALSGAWFLPAIAAAVVRHHRPAARAIPFVLAATLLLLGNGMMGSPTLAPLEPPYRSNWLAVHVVFAWLAFGSYLVTSILAGYHLVLTARSGTAAGERPALIDELAAKLVAFGFVSHSVMIASGAIWAHGLWGRYWAWDPIETWSLVSWLVYAVYLHLRFTLGWKGRRASWVALGAVAGIVVVFFGIGAVSDVHTQLL